MKNFITITIIVLFYFAENTKALYCYKCGHLTAVGRAHTELNKDLSLFPSFDESCKITPNVRFLTLCEEPSIGKSALFKDSRCAKVVIKGVLERLPVKVNTLLRDCVKFPKEWPKGCKNWTKSDLLYSSHIAVDFKRLASYFTGNATMEICTCKGNKCDFKTSMEGPSQNVLGGNKVAELHQYFKYSKRFVELVKEFYANDITKLTKSNKSITYKN